MKKLLLLAALSAAFSLNASASTNEDAYIARFEGRTDIPRPVKVVSPTVSQDNSGKVHVLFMVSPAGRVHGVQVVKREGFVDTFAVVSALRSWKFLPREGQEADVPVSLTVNVNA